MDQKWFSRLGKVSVERGRLTSSRHLQKVE